MRFFGDPTSIQRDYELPEFRHDAAGFKASVHIQVGAADPMAEAKWIQAVADANPDWLLRQVVFCDLTADDVAVQLKAFMALPSVVGVRQIVGRAPGEDAKTGTNALLSDPKFVDGLKQAAERGFSFDLQLLPELMVAAAEVFEQVPDLPVALCHAGSPHDRSQDGLAAYASAMTALADLPQVVCKISGLGMFDHGWTTDSVRPLFKTCLAHFGPERLMFGSNFPVCSLSSTYAELVERYSALTESLTKEAQAAFWGDTAAAFYGFDVD